jgi:hypothetical protein
MDPPATAMQRSITGNRRKYRSNARQKRHHSCFLHSACREGAIEFPILLIQHWLPTTTALLIGDGDGGTPSTSTM